MCTINHRKRGDEKDEINVDIMRNFCTCYQRSNFIISGCTSTLELQIVPLYLTNQLRDGYESPKRNSAQRCMQVTGKTIHTRALLTMGHHYVWAQWAKLHYHYTRWVISNSTYNHFFLIYGVFLFFVF